MKERGFQLASVALMACVAAVGAMPAAANGQCTVSAAPHVGLHAVAGQATAFSADVNATNCTGTVRWIGASAT